jgi:hypothetical protein
VNDSFRFGVKKPSNSGSGGAPQFNRANFTKQKKSFLYTPRGTFGKQKMIFIVNKIYVSASKTLSLTPFILIFFLLLFLSSSLS